IVFTSSSSVDERESSELLTWSPDSVSGAPRSPRSETRVSVALRMSSAADLSPSVERFDVSENCDDTSCREVVQSVIAVQKPLAHSSVGLTSLELSLPPQPAARPATATTSTAIHVRRIRLNLASRGPDRDYGEERCDRPGGKLARSAWQVGRVGCDDAHRRPRAAERRTHEECRPSRVAR